MAGVAWRGWVGQGKVRHGDGGKMVIDFLPHPITTEGRKTLTAIVPQGETLDKVLGGIVPPALPAVAVVNGTLISRPKWATTRITKDSIIQVRSTLQGGDGSNPFAVILSIAAVVFAPHLAGAIFGTAFTGTVLGSVVVAGIGIGGVLVANALFPPRFPDDRSRGAEPEKQYSLSGGANRARPHEPFLLVLGQHRVFPDLVSKEYTEFSESVTPATGTPVVVSRVGQNPEIYGIPGVQDEDIIVPPQTTSVHICWGAGVQFPSSLPAIRLRNRQSRNQQ